MSPYALLRAGESSARVVSTSLTPGRLLFGAPNRDSAARSGGLARGLTRPGDAIFERRPIPEHPQLARPLPVAVYETLDVGRGRTAARRVSFPWKSEENRALGQAGLSCIAPIFSREIRKARAASRATKVEQPRRAKTSTSHLVARYRPGLPCFAACVPSANAERRTRPLMLGRVLADLTRWPSPAQSKEGLPSKH